MNSPLVSILIPVYNAEAYIENTINSCLNQTYKNIEVIIVNDGSTDSSEAIINKFRGEPRIKYYLINNSGGCQARNHAYSKSSGELIQYLDADDLLDERKIEFQINEYLKHGSKFIYSAKWGNIINNNRGTFEEYPLYKDFSPILYWKACFDNFGTFMPLHCWLTPRAIHEKVADWNKCLKINQDGEFFCRVLMASSGVKFVPQSIVWYNRDVLNSVSRTRSNEIYSSLYNSCTLMAESVLKNNTAVSKKVALQIYSRFYCSLYPHCPDLLKQCLLEINQLGFRRPLAYGGKIYKIVATILGIKLTYKVKSCLLDV